MTAGRDRRPAALPWLPPSAVLCEPPLSPDSPPGLSVLTCLSVLSGNKLLRTHCTHLFRGRAGGFLLPSHPASPRVQAPVRGALWMESRSLDVNLSSAADGQAGEGPREHGDHHLYALGSAETGPEGPRDSPGPTASLREVRASGLFL